MGWAVEGEGRGVLSSARSALRCRLSPSSRSLSPCARAVVDIAAASVAVRAGRCVASRCSLLAVALALAICLLSGALQRPLPSAAAAVAAAAAVTTAALASAAAPLLCPLYLPPEEYLSIRPQFDQNENPPNRHFTLLDKTGTVAITGYSHSHSSHLLHGHGDLDHLDRLVGLVL